MNPNAIAAVFWAVLITMIAVFIPFAFPWLIKTLAEKRFLFIEPIEGRFLYIVRGRSLKRTIYSIENMVLDKETRKMVPGNRDGDKNWLERKYGVQWIGTPFTDSVFEFPLSWDDAGKEKGVIGQSIIPHVKETVDGLYYRSTYIVIAKEAETAGKIPLTVTMSVTVIRAFPERAAFALGGDPEAMLNTVFGLIKNQTQKVLKTLSIDEVIGTAAKDSTVTEQTIEKVVQSINTLNNHTDASKILSKAPENGTEGALSFITGYEIVTVAIESIEPIMTPEEVQTLRAEALAKMQGDADIALAERQGKATILRGKAAAKALEVQAKVMSRDQNARIIAIMDRVAGTNLITLGGELGKDSGVNVFVQPQNQKKKGENIEE